MGTSSTYFWGSSMSKVFPFRVDEILFFRRIRCIALLIFFLDSTYWAIHTHNREKEKLDQKLIHICMRITDGQFESLSGCSADQILSLIDNATDLSEAEKEKARKMPIHMFVSYRKSETEISYRREANIFLERLNAREEEQKTHKKIPYTMIYSLSDFSNQNQIQLAEMLFDNYWREIERNRLSPIFIENFKIMFQISDHNEWVDVRFLYPKAKIKQDKQVVVTSAQYRK
jgi:hypothetical protein